MCERALHRLGLILRAERLAQGPNFEDVASRSKLDKAARSRLEAGKPANPTVATLLRYVHALGMRLSVSLEPRPKTGNRSG